METINIKGKEYTPVNQRIIEFRTNKKYDGWQLITEIVSVSDTSVLFKSSAINKDGVVMATGYAGEEKQASAINNFNFIENGETSSVGRCLGFLGIFVDSAIASAEEVKNAVEKQDKASAKETKQNASLGSIQIKYGKYANKKLQDLSKDELKEVCCEKNEWLKEKANEYYKEQFDESFSEVADLVEIANKSEDLPF